MTRQQLRQQTLARHVIAAVALARHLEEHDEALRGSDDRLAAEYTQSLLSAHTRSIRVGRAYCDRYGHAATSEVLRHVGSHH